MIEFKCGKVYKHKYSETKKEFAEKSIHNLKAIYKELCYEEHYARKIIGQNIDLRLLQYASNIIHRAVTILRRIYVK